MLASGLLWPTEFSGLLWPTEFRCCGVYFILLVILCAVLHFVGVVLLCVL